MTRAGFLKLLGFAPLLPIAARIPEVKPTLSELRAKDIALIKEATNVSDSEWANIAAYYMPQFNMDAVFLQLQKNLGMPASTLRTKEAVARFRKRSDAAKRGWIKRRLHR